MVIGLAPSHPLVSKKMPIKAVKFQSEHRDFTKNVVRGAKKRVRMFFPLVMALEPWYMRITF